MIINSNFELSIKIILKMPIKTQDLQVNSFKFHPLNNYRNNLLEKNQFHIDIASFNFILILLRLVTHIMHLKN